MNRIVAILKATFAVAYLGALFGAVTSYAYHDWQWHPQNFETLLSSQARPFYLRMVRNYVGLAFMLAAPIALVVTLVLAWAVNLFARRHYVGRIYWVAFGTVAGAVSGVAVQAAFGASGAPIFSGTVGGAAAGLLLAKVLQTWLLPTQRVRSIAQ